MAPGSIQSLWWAAVTLFIALTLTVIQLPVWLGPARPAWAVLAVVYWHLRWPHRYGFLVSWCVGLLLDALTGTALGEHALALILVSFCTLKAARYVYAAPAWLQALALIPLLLLYEFILFWIDGITGHSVAPLWRWLPALTSVVFWLPVSGILDTLSGQRAEA
jgi:rod shape-determining protein MreD